MKRGLCLLAATVFTVVSVSFSPAQQPAKKVLTMIETLLLPRWEGYVMSHDGKKIAFTKTVLDTSDFESVSHIWLYDVTAGETMQLTASSAGESSPRWLPDGRLLFTSKRDGDEKVYVISPGGGEGVPFFDDDDAPVDGVFSPDYTKIAYTKKTERPDREEWEKKKEKKDDGYYWEREDLFTHIWVYDIAAKTSRRITAGNYDNTEPAWSPDGKWIAFTSNRTGTRYNSPGYSNNSDIWIVPPDSGAVRRVTTNKGPDRSPAWSPDGKWIACLSSRTENVTFDQFHVMVVPSAGGSPVDITAGLDYSASELLWSKDSGYLYYAVNRAPSRLYFRSPRSGGSRISILPDDGYVYRGLSLSEDGTTLLFTGSSSSVPGEVFTADAEGGGIRNILSPTDHMAGFAIAREDVVRWKGADGWEIDGILTYPLTYREGEKYPLILIVHGGPHGAYYKSFSADAQKWAARGYAVLRANPRGSSGHTFAYGRGVFNDWGGKDFTDLMKGVDYIVERGIADPARLGIMGGSYGGYMTFWTVSQTNRFSAAIGRAGIADLFPLYGQTDVYNYFDNTFGVPPWENAGFYDRVSAARFAKNVTTPLLIVHGEEDRRVPITQAEEYYRFLRKMGKTVEFLRFPREGHGVDEPRHRLHLDREEQRWFEKYLSPEGTEKRGRDGQ